MFTNIWVRFVKCTKPIILFVILFIWLVFVFVFLFWLCWVFVAALRLSLPAVSKGYSLDSFLISAPSLVVELSRLWHRGLVTLGHVECYRTRYWTYVPHIGRLILNHWTTREIPKSITFNFLLKILISIWTLF